MTDITYKPAETLSELQQILQLQKLNLPEAVSKEEQNEEGFVTVRHDLEILRLMNDSCPHNIAVHNNQVIGYALSMHPDFGNSIEILKPMFEEIDKVVPNEISYLVMGQICIDKAYRKQGIFRGLYSFMKDSFKNDFDWIITEVDVQNQRSLQAHKAVGFKSLSSYISSNISWELIYLQT